MDERSSLGTVSKRGCSFRNARARNTRATSNRSFPAQVFTETAVFSLRHKRKVYLDWSRHSWGYDCDPAYETYDSLPPVNLGVVLGDPPSVLAALERLVCDLEACGGWDQFVFSKLVYTTVSPRVYTTDDGPVADPRRAPAPTFRVTRRPPPAQVANLCSNLEARVGDAGAVLNADGRPYALVHQWDRYDAVAAHVAARYPYVAAWGP